MGFAENFLAARDRARSNKDQLAANLANLANMIEDRKRRQEQYERQQADAAKAEARQKFNEGLSIVGMPDFWSHNDQDPTVLPTMNNMLKPLAEQAGIPGWQGISTSDDVRPGLFMGDLMKLKSIAQTLGPMGRQLAIDNFGRGYTPQFLASHNVRLSDTVSTAKSEQPVLVNTPFGKSMVPKSTLDSAGSLTPVGSPAPNTASAPLANRAAPGNTSDLSQPAISQQKASDTPATPPVPAGPPPDANGASTSQATQMKPGAATAAQGSLPPVPDWRSNIGSI